MFFYRPQSERVDTIPQVGYQRSAQRVPGEKASCSERLAVRGSRVSFVPLAVFAQVVSEGSRHARGDIDG